MFIEPKKEWTNFKLPGTVQNGMRVIEETGTPGAVNDDSTLVPATVRGFVVNRCRTVRNVMTVKIESEVERWHESRIVVENGCLVSDCYKEDHQRHRSSDEAQHFHGKIRFSFETLDRLGHFRSCKRSYSLQGFQE